MAHILIVDDSPTDLHVLSGYLKKHGHEISTAGNAEEGIALARDAHPDLILMDVVMPGMNGFQATRSLSRDERTSDIPIIIISTKSAETDRVWGMRQGAKEYLAKPASERDLMSRVNALLQS